MINLKITNRQRLLEKEFARIIDVLKKKYAPEKIILFGSFVNGIKHQWSDIDIVIIKDTNENFVDRLQAVSLLTRPAVGVNFIVYTPKEAQQMIDNRHYFFTEEILKKGKVIYEKTE